MSGATAPECQPKRVICVFLHGPAWTDAGLAAAPRLLFIAAVPPDATMMTIYLYAQPFDGAPRGATLLRLNALRALRDELTALAGLRVSPVPQGADLEVVLTNVIASDDGPGALRDSGHRILVIRMARAGERLDFVCSDGRGLSAERQAARRIRNWMAGDDLFSSSVNLPVQSDSLRAIA